MSVERYTHGEEQRPELRDCIRQDRARDVAATNNAFGRHYRHADTLFILGSSTVVSAKGVQRWTVVLVPNVVA